MNKGFGLPAIFLMIAGVMLLLVGATYFFTSNDTESVACPTDAKLCPDGSAVGRIGPNCEFAECPGAAVENDFRATSQEISMCGKLINFKDEAWAPSLAISYSDWLTESELTGTLWPDGKTMAGDLSACQIGNYFIFIPEFFEFGCGMMFRYDISKDELLTTGIAAPEACADTFGEVTDSYIEYFGSTGDGGETKEYHGRYHFGENRVENL